MRIALAGGSGLVLLVAAWLGFIALTSPPAEALRDYRPPQASFVLDKDGKLLARLAPQERIVVPLQAMSPKLVQAFLSVEDQRFYQHGGIDLRRVLGALWHNLRALRAREGSSTITMQLARNVFPDQMSRAHSLRRKIAEVFVARRIESAFGKQQILELYLNQIYLGNGYYGVEAAARGYFGRPARDLTLAQAAVLAALPKAPSNYDPRRHPEAAVKRRNLVLALMESQKVITRAEHALARRSRLVLTPEEQEGGAPWFVAAVRRELHDRFGPDAETLGLRVRTTLDSSLQHLAETELWRQIAQIERGAFGKFPHPRCGNEPDECLEGLFVALDPQTGAVRALVGGRDYALSEFDRVTQAHRQPGSTFKPFVWAAAVDLRVPVTTLLDTDQMPKDYAPADGQAAEARALNLREGLRVSSNRAAVALGQRVGLDAVSQMAGMVGLRSPIAPYPSSYLGASTVVPLELVSAFAPFTNGGTRVEPQFIEEVQSATGEVLFHEEPRRAPALHPAVAWLMADLLSDVVDRGTGAVVRQTAPPGLPLMGKTGTTNRGQDVWFVGASPDLLAGVWLGFDRLQPVAKNATGGRYAAPVFGRVMAGYYRNKPLPQPIPQPAGLEERAIDVETGALATSTCPEEHVSREWFLEGTAPKAECPKHQGGGVAGFFERTLGGLFH